MNTVGAVPECSAGNLGAWRPVPTGSEDALEVLVTELDLGPTPVRACTPLLSDAERRRAARFVSARAARRFIVGRARLRQLLAERLGVLPEGVALVSGPRGKPELAGLEARAGLRFNLSRHDEVAVCVLAYDREVGIDVEAVRPVPDADAFVAHWFAPVEREAYRALAPEERPLGFFNCWTRKEAFVKALGAGLSHPLDSFAVSLAPGAPAQLLRVDRPSTDRRAWSLRSFTPLPGFVAAVVAERQ